MNSVRSHLIFFLLSYRYHSILSAPSYLRHTPISSPHRSLPHCRPSLVPLLSFFHHSSILCTALHCRSLLSSTSCAASLLPRLLFSTASRCLLVPFLVTLPRLLFFTALPFPFTYCSLQYISLGTWVCISILTSLSNLSPCSLSDPIALLAPSLRSPLPLLSASAICP